MASYVCVELVDSVCQTWAESFSLPPLSLAEGGELGFLVLFCYATAWGAQLLSRQIINHW